jgi:hypothetical protein
MIKKRGYSYLISPIILSSKKVEKEMLKSRAASHADKTQTMADGHLNSSKIKMTVAHQSAWGCMNLRPHSRQMPNLTEMTTVSRSENAQGWMRIA